MSAPKETVRLTTVKKAAFYAIYWLVVTAIFVTSAEFVLRARGVKPWLERPDVMTVEPGGKLVTRHPVLSYQHIPGRYVVTLGTGYGFVMTHLPNTLRISRPLERYQETGHKEQIWIFGCSYTHGWSVNDDETYAWLLQERFPDYDVVNYGVGGYATAHSLLQFREALKTTTPRAVIVAYAGFHDVRNTFARAHRKSVSRWNKLGPLLHPYARLDRGGHLYFGQAKVEHWELPLVRQSALAHFIEMKYDKFDARRLRSHEVSEALITEMARLAAERDVKFIVALIDGQHAGTRMLAFAAKSGISNVDISVDLRRPENTNLPHDSHPSAIANKRYADKLESFLRAELAK